ncbi:MAG: ATP synthase F0 subunit C [bacterium]
MRAAVLLAIAVVVAFTGVVYAQEESAPGTPGGFDMSAVVKAAIAVAAALGMAIAAFGVAGGESKVISAAIENIARQPEAAGRIQTVMIIGVGMLESLAIFTLVIALVLLFVFKV